MGRGCGQVVSMLAFSSDDLSSNPAEASVLTVKFVFEKKEDKQKGAGVAHLNNTSLEVHCWTTSLLDI